MKMKEQILKLREEGKTYSQIKAELGCSKSTISYHCGEGQKEKSRDRRRKNRENTKAIIIGKIEVFMRSSIREFKRGRSTLPTNSSISYTEAFDKILNNPICYLTGRKIDLEYKKTYQLDHIIPRFKGGNNEIDNMGLTCADANKSKTHLLVSEYLDLCKEVLEYNGYIVTKLGLKLT